jgi:hypothetical protein
MPRVVGAQYVVGSPPATPVLRPLKQPMYDTEIYPAAGVGRLQFFSNAATIAATGAAKTLSDTNMTQNGQLGTPLEFDLIGFNMEIQKRTDVAAVADFNGIINTGVWQWIFGQNTPWLTVPVSRIPEGVAATGGFATTVAATTLLHQSNGTPHVTNFYNFAVDRRARHIFSTESFRGELSYPSGVVPIATATRLRFFMLGILFAQL